MGNEELVAEVQALRAEVAALRRERAREAPPDSAGGLSRRTVLGLAGAALTGGIVASAVAAAPAAAATGTMQYGTANDSGTASTLLTSVSDSPTISLRNHGEGSAISQALNCFSISADGMASSSAGLGGNGVLGVAQNPTRSGVRGDHTNGTGVTGRATTGVGVRGRANGTGGRGAVLEGQAAQVQLVASSRATHPTSGRRGDLFVDASGRLWFCKGDTTWRQLA